ncbi:MAG: PepSY-associated TM helix domain-containing protein, partial [Parahaliea sp.]
DSGRERHHSIRFEHDPATLALLRHYEGDPRQIFEARHIDLAELLVRFHADLYLGSPLGLIVTGLLGLALFASLVTGVVIHRKILGELFSFRPRRSLRLLWTDSHKVLGVWGLLFHSVIAFTGAFLGFAAVVLVPAAALVSFGGDQQALMAAVLPDIDPRPSGEPRELRFAALLDTLRAKADGDLVSISLLLPEDRKGLLVANTQPGAGMTPRMLQYRLADGGFDRAYPTYGKLVGFSGPVLDVLQPLHFGNFGGVWVKALWCVLGVSTALLALSGMMIWIERRAYGPVGELSWRQYLRIARFSIGVCGGLVVAVITLFHGQRLLPGPALVPLFFASWSLAASWALLRDSEYRAARELALCSGLLALGVPLLDAATSGHHLFRAVSEGMWTVAGVDGSLLLGGALLVWLARRIPVRRPLRRKHSRGEPLVARKTPVVAP